MGTTIAAPPRAITTTDIVPNTNGSTVLTPCTRLRDADDGKERPT